MKEKHLLNKMKCAASKKVLALIALVSSFMPMISRAAGGDPQSVVMAAVDAVVKIFPYIGIFFVASGAFKLIMAYRNDQPEAQAGAAKDIVIGAVCIVFATFIWAPIKTAATALF